MLNDKLFSMLERYAPNDVDHVLVLHPPDDDDEAKLGTGALLHTMEMTTRPASKSIGRGGGGGGGYQGGAAGGSPQMHAAAAAAVPPVQESKQPAPEPAAALPPPAPAPPPRAAAPAPLPPNWQEVPANDGTGDFYFWNEATNETYVRGLCARKLLLLCLGGRQPEEEKRFPLPLLHLLTVFCPCSLLLLLQFVNPGHLPATSTKCNYRLLPRLLRIDPGTDQQHE